MRRKIKTMPHQEDTTKLEEKKNVKITSLNKRIEKVDPSDFRLKN